MNSKQIVSQITELHKSLETGQISLSEFSISFEATLRSGFYEERDLPQKLLQLINRVEILQYTLLEENQPRAITSVVMDAIRLLSSKELLEP
ncbi:hypothetical protein ACN27F_15020 [Solwaraspora sp. WMMB335]|uniref:hypothetical protein n=1 Tax=Solwaraspora sp. WMMB335 TaxID=3404118 RepID=UPI003B92C587